MKKILEKIKDYFSHRTVYIRDHYYDWYFDNDDLDDPMTIVKVTYSKFKGVINVELAEYDMDESPVRDHWEFFEICNINEYGGLPECKKYSLLRNE